MEIAWQELKGEGEARGFHACERTRQRRRTVLKRRGGGGGGEGGSSSTLPCTYSYTNFLKCPLHCSLAQANLFAIYTVSSVSVIDL